MNIMLVILPIGVFVIYLQKYLYGHTDEVYAHPIKWVTSLGFLMRAAWFVFCAFGFNLLNFLINRMVISCPIDLLWTKGGGYAVRFLLLNETKDSRIPLCFNLYRQVSRNEAMPFKKLTFWQEYHALKCIATNSTDLNRIYIFQMISEKKEIPCLSLLFDYSSKSFGRLNTAFSTSQFLQKKSGDSNNAPKKTDGKAQQIHAGLKF